MRRLNTSPGETNFDKRWDLVPGSTVGKHINIADIASLGYRYNRLSADVRRARAYGKTCPFDPGPS